MEQRGVMGKKKIYVIIVALIIAVIFSASAICSQCGMSMDEEGKIDVSKEEDTETPAEESERSEDIEESDGDDEKTKPTIKLEIYEGPTPAPGNVCYYRVEAIVTGNPEPEVKFSKDDSNEAWGSKKAQVNLIEGEIFILEATATNSEGADEKSISLSWVYNEEGVAVAVLEPSDGDGLVMGEELVVEFNRADVDGGDGDEGDGDDNGNDDGPETTMVIIDTGTINTYSEYRVHGQIGLIKLSFDIIKVGIEADTDSRCEGILDFNIEELEGKEIQSAALKINGVTAYEPRDGFEELEIRFSNQPIVYLDYNTTNINYNGNVLLDEIKESLADNQTTLWLGLRYKNPYSYYDENYIFIDNIDHGISFLPENAKLEVIYLK